MAFSDDEETVPEFVTDYYFLDDDESAILFTDLPIQFDIAEEMDATNRKAFLRGISEGALLKVYIQVIAWKLLLEDDQPQVMVLAKEDKWINLKKPRKCYGEMIRTILIIFQFLHFLKKNPLESVKILRDHLCEVFGTFAFKHFKKNFREYISLIKVFTEKDKTLAKAPLLLEFLNEIGADLCDSVCAICDGGGELLCCEGRCLRCFHATESAGEDSGCNSLGYSKAQVEAIQIFLCKNCQYNQHQCFAYGKLGSSDKKVGRQLSFGRAIRKTFAFKHFKKNFREYISLIKVFTEKDKTLAKAPLLLEFLNEIGADLCDSVCAICDGGGELLCCEGRCLRCFHATESAGEDSGCNSLGYSKAQVEAIQIFLCKNCQYNQHQCFACGKLGSSDKSAGSEVFCCVSATCGRFYHPKCAAELLCPDNKSKASKYQKRIEAGKSFTCPVHKCIVCRQRENKEVRELQFAICRRCPKSYHRKCLPREITFEDAREGIVQRAWDGLLPNCTLMYCLNHTVMEELTTPVRDHVIFPDAAGNKKIMIMQKKELEILVKKTSEVSDDLPRDQTFVNAEKIVNKLQWYVQDGDMIVDLCCDANASSQLMKEKLDASGKICLFQSCDIIQPKNFFNFEKRDWLQVKPGELSVGSKLIMVLNSPFGVQADVANKFIDKALTFKPKLLILTVPEETERLDRKSEPYDLIWEDSELLSEKSFSLSGSVDVNGHQAEEQSNLKPPVLYLWSHPTWTKIYKDIAMEHGHTSTKHGQHDAEAEEEEEALVEVDVEEECRKKDVAPEEGAGFGNKRPSSENHVAISCKKKLKSKHNPEEGSQSVKVLPVEEGAKE